MHRCLFPTMALLFLGISLAAEAETALQETLKAGTIACLTLKDTQDYWHFVTVAPKFAQDLLDRATCYPVKDTSAVIRRDQQDGYRLEQLLSGHRVWVPLAATASATQL